MSTTSPIAPPTGAALGGDGEDVDTVDSDDDGGADAELEVGPLVGSDVSSSLVDTFGVVLSQTGELPLG